jgi:hypothetical protein
MQVQGWPLWAVSDEEYGRGVYAIIGWTDDVMEPVGIALGGISEAGRAAEVLSCPLVFVGTIKAAKRIAAGE